MNESISYSFLLNIIIVFVFVCASIVTGIFSYYRAFRAGTAIVNEIEKYEGYNCVSALSISEKLNQIGYLLPFKIECEASDENCIISADGNYKVVSFNYNDKLDSLTNADINSESIFYNSNDDDYLYSGSDLYCGQESGQNKCYNTSKYGYGIYTYMYTDLPVISGFLKIPIYFKTKDMIEYRNLTVADNKVFNLDVLPYLYWISEAPANAVFNDFGEQTLDNYANRVTAKNKYYGWLLDRYGYGVRRDNNVYDPDEPLTQSSIRKYNLRDLFRWANSSEPENGAHLKAYYKNICGYQIDWSLY